MQNSPILKATRVSVGAALVMIVAGGAAVAVPAASGSVAAPRDPAGRLVADVTGGAATRDATGSNLAQSRNAARSRMRECGHQWSAMKKNGAASGMTWKDFSQGCLAKQ